MNTSADSSPQSISERSLWRVLQIARQLGAPLELSDILSQAVDAAREVLNADRGSIFLYDNRADELFIYVGTGVKEIRFPADQGIAGQCAQTRQIIHVPDCYADERFNRDIDRKTGYRTRCLLAVPLIGHDDSLVGVLQVLNKHDGVFTEQDQELASILGAQCAVALQRARLIEEQLVKQKLERDLTLARDIQQGTLPSVLPEIEGYDVAGWNRPADETGGDVYDLVQCPSGQLAVLLGDATGHGIGPALSVSQVRAMFRMSQRLEAPLRQVFEQINEQLTDDLPQSRFVTTFIGMLDPAEHMLNYFSGGQGPLMHFRAADQTFRWLDASTIPLGIMVPLVMDEVPPIEMQPGDIFGLISDGIFEYENGEQMFGTERTEQVIRDNAQLPAEQLIERLCDAVSRFSNGTPQGDDMTIVFIKRTP